MRKLLKDPLVHFLLIGAGLFALSAWRGEWIRAGRERIVIGADQVAQVRDAATLLKGRAPTDDEVAALIEPTIRDEVLYREALALKLDQNDDEVRRRLVDKMNYLTQDTADPAPSSDAELREFYDRSPARFEMPELATFDQVFFSPAERGESVEADANAGIAALRSGRPPEEVGDHTPLRASYENAPRDQVAGAVRRRHRGSRVHAAARRLDGTVQVRLRSARGAPARAQRAPAAVVRRDSRLRSRPSSPPNAGASATRPNIGGCARITTS